jgi:hypothetical protein
MNDFLYSNSGGGPWLFGHDADLPHQQVGQAAMKSRSHPCGSFLRSIIPSQRF